LRVPLEISGIYDMSGGVWEYVMGVMTDLNGVPLSGGNDMYHSGFIGSYGEGGSLTSRQHWPAQKYYDTYVYQSISYKYTSRILGDAIGEMGPFSGARYENVSRTITSWYADVAHFLNPSLPWVIRGGSYSYGMDTGVFAFFPHYGASDSGIAFRTVLTPTN